MVDVVVCGEIQSNRLSGLLAEYGLEMHWVADPRPIPGSHFGEPEAGLISNRLYIRNDTPIHSLLHEACHFICMDEQRRQHLHTDAGGGYDEENAVCYLSILLANEIPGYSAEQMMQDMDTWGYTFRLGSARSWFEHDAEDALDWLLSFQIIGADGQPNRQLRA